jgi:hypothetical protein
LGGLKPPPLGGSFSISSLPLVKPQPLESVLGNTLDEGTIGEADLANFSC